MENQIIENQQAENQNGEGQNLGNQNISDVNHPNHKLRSRQVIKAFETKLSAKKTRSEKIADYLTSTFGTMGFFIFNLSCFFAWVIWNSGLITGLPIFDPYPHILLITIVSLEAICLSVLVLISQNRAAKIDRLRSEMVLQIDMISEQEITKLMSLVILLLEKKGIDVRQDPEIQRMLKRINLWYIEKRLEEQLK